MKPNYWKDKNGNKISVIHQKAKGLCDVLKGLTMVVFKKPGDKLPTAMEKNEFKKKYTKI